MFEEFVWLSLNCTQTSFAWNKVRTITAENRYVRRMTMCFPNSGSSNCGYSFEANSACIPSLRSDLSEPPMKPFVSLPQAHVHGKASCSPPTHLSSSTGSRTRGFKAKALRACCIVCDEPSGATAHENCTLVLFSPHSRFFLRLFLRPMCSAQFRHSCRWRGGTSGGQSPVRRSKSEDLRGGKTTCEGNKKKPRRGTMNTKPVRVRQNKEVIYRAPIVKRGRV